jgi:hypothetical protein
LPAPVRTTLGAFDIQAARSVVGSLVSEKASAGFATQYAKQIEAWEEELRLLDLMTSSLVAQYPSCRNWSLLLEYEIPRRNKYPDAILLADDLVFVLEFKIGATTFDAAARWQVEDYALDLRDFHVQSQGRTIIPILVATGVSMTLPQVPVNVLPAAGYVWPVACLEPTALPTFLLAAYRAGHRPGIAAIDPLAWDASPYRPSLSIIEAATTLFAGHSVREISHAYADNLSATTDQLIDAIHTAKQQGLRTLCFVTGVPGAGKTLTGLNAIHNVDQRSSEEWSGVFLSGNGPLVRIVRQAIVRDAVRLRGGSKKDATRKVSTFIQNVHDFMEAYRNGKSSEPPHENVVVFDEAQRAWSAEQVRKKRKVDRSEPRMMLEIMERCPQWCVIVALVGGGQEIHLGEAGLEEWGRALSETARDWQILVSPEALVGGPSMVGHCVFDGAPPPNCRVTEKPGLHLNVTVRSPRAQVLTRWVNSVLEGDSETARRLITGTTEFPLVMTRDLDRARQWLRDRSRSEHRSGLLVSSGSLRHRAYGIEVSSGFRRGYPFDEWFLGSPGDVRTSYQLEVAATEFECQGLELDWAGVCWGDDLCIAPSGDRWTCRQFRGNRWQIIRKEQTRRYLLNKYRVLLTRAREGMLLWVPRGDPTDPTREPAPLNRTAAYLAAAGISSL